MKYRTSARALQRLRRTSLDRLAPAVKEARLVDERDVCLWISALEKTIDQRLSERIRAARDVAQRYEQVGDRSRRRDQFGSALITAMDESVVIAMRSLRKLELARGYVGLLLTELNLLRRDRSPDVLRLAKVVDARTRRSQQTTAHGNEPVRALVEIALSRERAVADGEPIADGERGFVAISPGISADVKWRLRGVKAVS